MVKEPARAKIVLPDDLDPQHTWDRPLQAPGQRAVDFEDRVNFERLHRYRLARVRQALAKSGLGALLCFDNNNIRYTTSTVIGEWSRDKMTRFSLLTGEYAWRKKGTGILPGDAALIVDPARPTVASILQQAGDHLIERQSQLADFVL